jgi:hypothetical protein
VAFSARGKRYPVNKEDFFLLSFDYFLDTTDPDVSVLRREDGTFVAAFGAPEATIEGIVEAAKQDHQASLREKAGSPAVATEEHRSA